MNWDEEIHENNNRRKLNIIKGFKDSDDALEKAKGSKHVVGEVNPNNSEQIWTEYAPGKFDWRRAENAKMHANEVKRDREAAALIKESKQIKLPEGFRMLKSADFNNSKEYKDVVSDAFKGKKFTPEEAENVIKFLELQHKAGKMKGASHYFGNRIYYQQQYFKNIANKK